MLQTLPVICRDGSGTPLQKLGVGKGGSHEGLMKKWESKGEVGVRLYVSCICL